MKLLLDKRFQKRLIRFLFGIVLLISLNLIGNWLSPFIPFPLPGSVIGLILISTLLVLGWVPLKWVDDAAKFLLSFMSLFYVPYGIGIISIDDTTLAFGWKILLVVSITTVMVLLITGKLFTYIKSKSSHE